MKDLLENIRLFDELTWAEVTTIHKSRNGIYQVKGRLISLLTDFGHHNPCYPDFHGNTPNTIHYTGSGRRGDQKLDVWNRAMISAIQSAHPVTLFNKRDVGSWEYLGLWAVASSDYVRDAAADRMVWRFILTKVDAH